MQDLTGKHVAILGLGPSLEMFVDVTKRMGSRKAFCDEVWGINAVAGVIQCDRVFHMDDFRVQEIRARALPESNIAHMIEVLKTHPGPIYTSVPHSDYPSCVPFPLEEAINEFDMCYFNSTAAYAVAFAVLHKVGKISCFGMDFTYPNSNQAERGRGCVEYWLGYGKARGVTIAVPTNTSLLDACVNPESRLYGYDGVTVEMDDSVGDGKIKLRFTPRELPTAKEIEERYDHTVHPNPLVKEAA